MLYFSKELKKVFEIKQMEQKAVCSLSIMILKDVFKTKILHLKKFP